MEETKILILATINYGKAQITQSWEFLKSGQSVYLILHEANDGKIVIPLDKNLIKDMSLGIASPKKVYSGILNAADAINLNPN